MRNWLETKHLIQRNPHSFKRAVRRVFESEFGTISDLEVYIDDDAVMVVVGEEVYVNTEDEPMLLIGSMRAIDIAILTGEIKTWQRPVRKIAG